MGNRVGWGPNIMVTSALDKVNQKEVLAMQADKIQVKGKPETYAITHN